MKHYIITDALIDRLRKHSKPGVFKSEYYLVLMLLKKYPLPEGTSSVRAIGFNSDGAPIKSTIYLKLDED
jgi:hypothetical protein